MSIEVVVVAARGHALSIHQHIGRLADTGHFDSIVGGVGRAGNAVTINSVESVFALADVVDSDFISGAHWLAKTEDKFQAVGAVAG